MKSGGQVINVLQVVTGFAWGGGERHVLLLLEAFRNSPLRLQLVVFHDGRLAKEARALGFPVHLIEKRFRGDFSTTFRLMGLIKRERADIVHTHLVGANLYGRIAGRLSRHARVISTLHYVSPSAMAPDESSLSQSIIFHADLWTSRLCDRLIATSDHLRGALVVRGMRSEKVVTIRNGVDLEALQPQPADPAAVRRELGLAPDTPLVGVVGSFLPVKRFDLFLKAAQRVAADHPDAVFLVVGDGGLRAELEAQASALGIENRVLFPGFRDDVPRVLSALDVFVLSSDSEGTPYVVVEAMAMGKPVVATKAGGVPEQVRTGTEGFLVDCGDDAGLASGISRLLSDDALRAEMGRRARARAEREFSQAKAVEQLQAVYREVLNRG